MLLTNDEKSKKIRENFRQRFMEKRNSDWFYTLPLEEDRKNIFGITEEAPRKNSMADAYHESIRESNQPRELKGAEKRVMMEEEMRKLREENNLLWDAIVKLLKLI